MEMVGFRLVILWQQQAGRKPQSGSDQLDREVTAHNRQMSWKVAKFITLFTAETPEAGQVAPGTTEAVAGRSIHRSHLVAQVDRDLFTHP